MTPKPSEAELVTGEASATIARALAKLLDASYYEPGHGPADEVCDIWRAAAADANRARDVLMARIRELEASDTHTAELLAKQHAVAVAAEARAEAAERRIAWFEAGNGWAQDIEADRYAAIARAEAAEKRVAELEADLAVVRELQDPNAWEKAATDAFRVQAHNTDLRARAEAAEKREGELTVERDAERMTRESLERRVVELESYTAGLAGTVDALRATPAAGVREALQKAARLIAANRLILGKYIGAREVERIEKQIAAALAGAEAGERRVFEGEVLETEEPCIHDDSARLSRADVWLGGLDGKRVRLVVEVLPDPKEAP